METRTEYATEEEKLYAHLVVAQRNAQQALDLLYQRGGPKRSLWYRMLLGRAQSILIGLQVQEASRRSNDQSISDQSDSS